MRSNAAIIDITKTKDASNAGRKLKLRRRKIKSKTNPLF